MAALLTDQTSDTTGTLESHSGPCTVFVYGDMDGARVVIQASATNTAADAVKVENGAFDGRTGAITVDALGTYYLRAIVENAGSSTSVTVTTTQ